MRTQTQAQATTHAIKHRWTDAVLFECEVPAYVESGMRTRYVLDRATAARADLRGADLRGADLRGADLIGADLRGADLSGAYLRGADLSGAYLRGADLIGADLRGADLSGAYLRGAYLRGAYLSGADLRGAASPEESIANLDRVREIILDNRDRLEMSHWHADETWKERTCAEETLCETTHCLAGWLQVCSTDKEVRAMESQTAGVLCAPIAAKMFFRGEKEVLAWLEERKYVKELAEREERKAARAQGAAQ